MIPWKLLDEAQTPGNGALLRLYQRDTEFSIKADNYELMNSRFYGSEDALANLTCQRITKNHQARVLIGGLGMGYTVRSALDGLAADAQVVVAELVPAIVRWNREILAELADRPLDDDRIRVHEADVAQIINAGDGDYDAILLDVDNGPQALTRKENDWLYSFKGLETAFSALRPKGVLAIWSSGSEPGFAQRLRMAGFEAEEIRVRSRRGGRRGAHHVIWMATRK